MATVVEQVMCSFADEAKLPAVYFLPLPLRLTIGVPVCLPLWKGAYLPQFTTVLHTCTLDVDLQSQ
jgi:hypothetical protein